MRAPIRVLLAVLAACAGTVKPDEMSADSHRREADHERQVARTHLDQYQPGAEVAIIVPTQTGADATSVFYPVVIYNPTQWHLDEAERHGDR